MGIAICIRRSRVQMGIVQSLTVCILLYGDLDHQIQICIWGFPWISVGIWGCIANNLNMGILICKYGPCMHMMINTYTSHTYSHPDITDNQDIGILSHIAWKLRLDS